jgi:phosphatidate phosphatase APP1
MGDQRDTSAVNRSIEDYVRRVRTRLEEGRDEIARQRRVAAETREHIDGVRRWIDETEQLRRASGEPA